MSKARTNADNVTADIAGITAGTGITGGGTSGTVTITNDMATTIAAKGDLIVGTGNDTYTNLTAATTNGYVLEANSATTSGLAWSAPSTPTLNEQRFTSSGTFTVPTGVTKVWVTAVGGGGGGVNREGSTSLAFGGFSGAYITEQVTVTPAATVSVTIGAGGAGQANTAASGGSSSFGSLTASGGSGGTKYNVSGGPTIHLNGHTGYGIGGVGGDSAGAAAANSGAGGGGGNNNSGTGGSGIVIVRWL